MKVLRLHGAGDLRLHDEPVPTRGADDMLLRVTAVGVCGSDLHWLHEGGIGDERLGQPLVLGHEFAAVIRGGERDGERVAVDPAIPCGACEFCQDGNPNLCLSVRFAGHGTQDGAFREYSAWPARCLHALPESMSDAEGAMLEPLGVAIHAVDLGHVKSGATVGVFGCGPIGLLAMQVARASGATSIVCTEKLPHRLEAARSLGATAVFAAGSGREVAQLLEATGGRGVDIAIEASNENAAVESAIDVTKPGGRVVLVGIPDEGETRFTASIARRKGLTILLARRMKHTYPRAIRLVESGLVDLQALLTHRFPLSQFDRAFAAAESREGLKVIIEP